MVLSHSLSYCLLAASVFTALAENKLLTITIPNSAWDGVKSLQCTGIPVDPNQYIQSFVPLYQKKQVHHIAVVTCDIPYSYEDVWECPTPNQVCSLGKSEALWAMSKDAPAWYVPKDFGVPIGSKRRYLVVQIHTHVKLETTPTFQSTGVILNITDDKPKYRSAIAIYGNLGYIPAHTAGFTADSSCRWPYSNNPLFGLKIHTHNLATAVTGYFYRNQTLIELVRADTDYPEPIIDISARNITLQATDYVVMRCTLTNPADRNVKFGLKHSDEMCNLYLFYGVSESQYSAFKPVICVRSAQLFHNDIYFDMPESSKLADKEGYAELLASYHLSKTKY